jgi:hypothetical protein
LQKTQNRGLSELQTAFLCGKPKFYIFVSMVPGAIINGNYFLYDHDRHKGWVYALIHDAKKVKGKYPKLKVKGTIDGFAISKVNLASYGHEGYILPLRAEIRKQIKKNPGDKVKVILYADESSLDIPEEFELCLNDAPKARKFFYSLSESEQRMYVLWISSAKKLETRSGRIVKSIERLENGLKLYES